MRYDIYFLGVCNLIGEIKNKCIEIKYIDIYARVYILINRR